VQPAEREAEGWRTEPFRFVRRGDRYFGRGTTDDKGPALAALFGVRAAREAGVPVGVRLLWEMEEEIGSPSLEPQLRRLATREPPHSVVVSTRPGSIGGGRLPSPDCAGSSDSTWCSTPPRAKRTPETSGGAARNPIAELMQLVADLHDARTGTREGAGLLRRRRAAHPGERAEFRRSGFSLATYKRDNHLRLLRAKDGSRCWSGSGRVRPSRSTAWSGGYTGPGIKATVPGHAEVKVSCRLVPRQRPERIARLVTAFIRKRNPDVVVRAEGASLPYEGSSQGPVADAVRAAMSFAFGRTPAFVRDGGTIGAVVSMARSCAARSRS
jgi:acetylornithine deacetylase/succinyl-diaminopimelate desuccinylase-like protein